MYLRPNSKRAQLAIASICSIMAINCIFSVLLFLQYQLIQDSINGLQILEEDALANDNRIKIVQVVYYIFYLISSITFILWFRRAYFNLHRLIDGLSFADNWATICWFIPLINLVRPYKIMIELYSVSKLILNKNGIRNNNTLNINTVNIWWTLWILVNLLNQIFNFFFKSATELDEIQASTISNIILNLIMILLSLITVKLISDYSKIEDSFHEMNDYTIESIGKNI